jgi:PAT family beta-lactamase induction signal transducer AmpG
MYYILLLGFSSGMPLFLTSRTLQAWLTVEGVDLTTVGLLSLVAIPYSLKFVWSPILDRFSLPFLGRRRGWMILSQFLLLAAIGAMALARPAEGITFLATVAILIAFFSATQDIAIDAYRTDVLEEREMGAGAAFNVLGYRVAMLLTGAGALILADRMGWPLVYIVMAAFMFVGMAASYRAPEPDDPGSPPASLVHAVRDPFVEFVTRLGLGRAFFVLGFIVVYKLGDALVNNMTTPFLLETGFTQTDVGAVQGGMGLFATILGTLAGGALLSRMGILRSLWVFGFFQAASNLVYLALAEAGRNYWLMVVTINFEYFSAGLGTAAFVAFLMSLCNHRFTATQYALLSSLMAVSRDVIASPSGRIAEVAGWPTFFFISFLMALPGLAMLWALRSLPNQDSNFGG